jgi:hypothetical protein
MTPTAKNSTPSRATVYFNNREGPPRRSPWYLKPTAKSMNSSRGSGRALAMSMNRSMYVRLHMFSPLTWPSMTKGNHMMRASISVSNRHNDLRHSLRLMCAKAIMSVVMCAP